VIRAGERRDAATQLAETDRMVEAAGGAGFAEVVAAVDRYMLAATTKAEPLETAVKAVTLAVYSLPFRPHPDTVESLLLNAWAAFDIASRHGSDPGGDAAVALFEAARAAQATKVLAGLMLLAQILAGADNPRAYAMACGAIGVKVYQAAYHRDPPSKEAFGF
jgi:hypothetical protein